MKIIVTVVEKITSEAHIDIPDGLNKSAIKQHILKHFFDNPPQSIKKRIAALDTEAINYLLGRKA